MIVLDTNVISEMTKPLPSSAVTTWLDTQPVDTMFITAVTVAEQGFGIALLPQGKRRQALEGALASTIALFAGRILPFDEQAAMAYASLAAAAKVAGRGFPTPDGYIAAIASARGFAVATRDAAPFHAGQLQVINPWEYAV